AGIVYVTDVTPAVRPQVRVIDIPSALNVVARYPIAVVTDAPNATMARAFIDYLLSPAGQAVLQGDGFATVGPAAARAGGADQGCGPARPPGRRRAPAPARPEQSPPPPSGRRAGHPARPLPAGAAGRARLARDGLGRLLAGAARAAGRAGA